MAIESVSLSDPNSGATAKILTGFGFNCYQFQAPFRDRMIDVIWSAEGFASGQESPSGSGIPLLFPFPGRIQGTTLLWNDKQYTLQDGDGRGNAIHGFVHSRPWRVVEQSPSHVVGQFQASVDDPRLLDCWPADFRLTATYRLSGSELRGHFSIENPDQQTLPCGLGTHPYFCVPLGGANADDCAIKFPVAHGWELNQMIVTGRKTTLENVPDYRRGVRFGEMKLDNVFGGLDFEGDLCETSIHDPDSGCTVRQTFDRAFGHLVVYNPPSRQAVCVEPYSCLPDPFRLRQEGVDAGLWVLEPGESREANVVIGVS